MENNTPLILNELTRLTTSRKDAGAPDIIEEVINHYITSVLGKGLLLDSEDEGTRAFLKNLAERTNLQQVIEKSFRQCLFYGRSLITINFAGNTAEDIYFGIANLIF